MIANSAVTEAILLANGRKTRRHVMTKRIVVPAIAVAAFLVVYETMLSGVVVSDAYLPKLGAIGSAIVGILGGGHFWGATVSTLWIALVGFVIGGGLAAVLGLVSGRNAYVYRALRFTVDFLRPIPAVALIPLVITIAGPTDTSRIFLVAFTVFWPMYLQAVYGVQDANPVAIDTARSFGLSKFATLFEIVFPSAAGYLASAVRINIVVSVLVSVSAELILGGGRGLGGMLAGYSQAPNYPAVFGMTVLLGFLGMAVVWLATRLERAMLFWHESHRLEVS